MAKKVGDIPMSAASNTFVQKDGQRSTLGLDGHLEILDRIQKRVLWLSTYMIHYANSIRKSKDGVKVGGHQASCTSLASVMTVLYFYALRSGDYVAVKPHASPVFHAIQALRGVIPFERLKEFRQFEGLQSYPSRTKDPDNVDFSTGSVGMGAVAPNFAALTRDYVIDHFDGGPYNRYISIVGDAELDEGSVWEAVEEENLEKLGKLLWIVDLNRQSLDRVVPDGKAQKFRQLFRINGWHVIDLKYGSKLEGVYSQPNGEKLRRVIDDMGNSQYQSLLFLKGEEIRERLLTYWGTKDEDLERLLRPYSDEGVWELLADLGGHDLAKIIEAFQEAERFEDQPVMIMAYTIKGWGLPLAGDPLNHSQQLTSEQIENLREKLGVENGKEFSTFPADSREDKYIRESVEALSRTRTQPSGKTSIRIPEDIDVHFKSNISTQEALGRILWRLSSDEEVAPFMVTTSPDVAVSTHLGGWINKHGMYSRTQTKSYFEEYQIPSVMDWKQKPSGRHIELGISENNFFLLLSMLGLSGEFTGQTLLPVGTIYDTFISRGLDALVYAAYCKSKFICIGTPSGVSLGSEGGAHQSIIVPGIGLQMPNVVYYEPAFAKELQWIFLTALKNLLDREHGKSVYLRLSTKPIPQDLFPGDSDVSLKDRVLKGGYRLIDHSLEPDYRVGQNVVNIFAVGVMVPEAVEASRLLSQEGIFANVIVVTSPDLLYRGYREANALRAENPKTKVSSYLEHLASDAGADAKQKSGIPAVTVMDGHSHTLSFIGGALGTRVAALGVDEFGQSGSYQELYHAYDISTESIVKAAIQILNMQTE